MNSKTSSASPLAENGPSNAKAVSRKWRWWRATLKLVVGVVILYAAACIALRLFYRHFVYYAPAPHAAVVPGVQELDLRASDGQAVHGLWFPATGDACTIAYFHGGGGTVQDDVPMASYVAKRGYGVLLVEYRGYGRSAAGAPSEAGLYLDAEAALAEAVRRGVPAHRTALWGYSLGTGVAAEMARRGRGAALVLIAPFTSLPDVVAHDTWLPASALLSDRFDTIAKASEIHVPTVVIHGDRDSEIPVEEGRRVAAAIPGARFVLVRGAGHEDVFDLGADALFGTALGLCRP